MIMAAAWWAVSASAWGQPAVSEPLRYSMATPRPINPAEGTTNPSARATQSQNPYLGSVPSPATGTTMELSLQGAIHRGLRYNLGLIESNQGNADVHADRLRALAALLPDLEVRGRQVYQNISYKEIGLKLPSIPGIPALPAAGEGFGFQDARVGLSQSIFNNTLRQEYRARKDDERASALNVKDSKDVVVLAVGTAYVQVIASAARVETAKAELASAQELDRQASDRVKSELSPEIDSLRAQVELQSAEQRLTNADNQYEKDKLTLARIVGLAVDQKFVLTDRLAYHPITGLTDETATREALQARADLASAEASVRAAQSTLRAQKAERLPVVSLNADFGGGGVNVGSFNSVYTVAGNISIPIYTGGRIQADIEQAKADLARKQAEYEDLRGRVAYDVRSAWLDVSASDSSVKVAERNKTLAEKALTQSRDRYINGVANYLEVVQAEEAVAGANDNYIDSLYSLNVAMISLARAMGGAETRLDQFLGAR
ncbi:MAG TPA: TolC family protein [Bryobacteraceae bacterium]|nr:TolC family protein [Bryobacteraceae bacterium]